MARCQLKLRGGGAGKVGEAIDKAGGAWDEAWVEWRLGRHVAKVACGGCDTGARWWGNGRAGRVAMGAGGGAGGSDRRCLVPRLACPGA